MRLAPRAKKVLELSLREALSLGEQSVGTEHILLGLVRENEGVASRILLVEFNADAEKVRSEVLRFLKERPGTKEAGFGTTEAVEAREVRPSLASAITAPAGWEYRVLSVHGLGEISEAELNSLGGEGWELVAGFGEASTYRLVFKRAKHEGD